MSTYVPIDFEDGVTPLNAATFDHLEDRIELLDALKVPDPTGLDEKWLKAEGGAMVWVDAPTGGGGAIEYENIWSAATPYTPGDVVEHEGVEYLAVNPSTGNEPVPAAAPSPVGVIPLVTSLPATPFDGQEVILTDSLTAPTYSWRLRYRAGSTSPYKWEFVGGAPAYVEVATSQTTTSTAYVNLTTVGPSFTLPNAGDWDIAASFHTNAAAGNVHATMSYELGAIPASDLWCVGGYVWSGDDGGWTRMYRHLALAAGTAVVAKYKSQDTPAADFDGRSLRLTPVRLS